MQSDVTVTGADRWAAAEYRQLCQDAHREGRSLPDLSTAFARHRLAALADAQVEPVAWMYEKTASGVIGFRRSLTDERWPEDDREGWTETPLYTQPPAQDVAALVKLLKAARAQMARIIGDHNAPSDCYATGPLTGDVITDLVSCPSCEGELMLADIAAILGGEA